MIVILFDLSKLFIHLKDIFANVSYDLFRIAALDGPVVLVKELIAASEHSIVLILELKHLASFVAPRFPRPDGKPSSPTEDDQE